jgi:hypothetical protein
MLTLWKEKVSIRYRQRASAFTCKTSEQSCTTQHYMNKVPPRRLIDPTTTHTPTLQVHSVVTASAENQLPVVYDRVLAAAIEEHPLPLCNRNLILTISTANPPIHHANLQAFNRSPTPDV